MSFRVTKLTGLQPAARRAVVLIHIDRAGGNVREAARALGVSRGYLHRLLTATDPAGKARAQARNAARRKRGSLQ